MKKYDYLVIGGGIFGLYTALYLSKHNKRICVLEKEDQLMKKASIVNQARLHAGYHYPRSVATALLSNEYKERFFLEHKNFINSKYDNYYAIDRYGSLTNSVQFEKFCKYINIKCKKVDSVNYLKNNRIEQLYLTEEYSFDPIMIAEYYKEMINQNSNIYAKMSTTIVEAEKLNDSWSITIFDSKENDYNKIVANSVINATYYNINTQNKLFGMPTIKLMHEITEMAFIHAPMIKNIGLTVLDGQYCSIMPYGLSDLHSLYSVNYSVHDVDYHDEPQFHCQTINKNCLPNYTSICNSCSARPISNNYKMQRQLLHYLVDEVVLQYQFSMYTIRSKLQYSYIDDGRPTIATKLNSSPDYYCLFAGKINSIFEIESKINNA